MAANLAEQLRRERVVVSRDPVPAGAQVDSALPRTWSTLKIGYNFGSGFPAPAIPTSPTTAPFAATRAQLDTNPARELRPLQKPRRYTREPGPSRTGEPARLSHRRYSVLRRSRAADDAHGSVEDPLGAIAVQVYPKRKRA